MSIYFAFGLVGNLCNCIVFTHRAHRRTPSSIFFLALSTFAIVYLLWTITPFFYSLNHLDPQSQSTVYCKIRLYVGHVLGLYVRYVIVFACADRFFATRSTARLRSMMTVSVAKRLVLLMCPVCLLIAVHMLVLLDIHNGVCVMVGEYKLLYAFYQIATIGVLPPVLMCIFSVSTLRALRRQRDSVARIRRRRDRYLLRMVTAEVAINVVTSIPYSANLLYGAVTYSRTEKSVAQVQIESFVSFLTVFVAYLLCVAPFYLFVALSKPFRSQLVGIIRKWFGMCADRSRRRVAVFGSSESHNKRIMHGRVFADRA